MIIVTLSVVFTLKGMARWLIQRIKAMLLCIVYGIFFVDTVDTKIKACNALNAMFVKTVDTPVFVALTEHLIQSTMRCENSTLLCIKWTLTLIFNQFSICKKFWKAETPGLSNHTIKCYVCQSMLEVLKVKNYLQHLLHRYYLMVWLESPKCQLSKTFCGLKIS